MKFSIIGNGFIFPTHLKAIQEIGGEIVGRDCGEDFISILTPNHLHFEQCLEEAKKGKTVLCEKPLCLDEKQIKTLAKYDIYTVLQLRYHPLVKEILKKKRKFNVIELDISVHRGDDYFDGWKGDKRRSGGIAFNLGIHYFDLLFHLFGYPVKSVVLKSQSDNKNRRGMFIGENYSCKWKLKLDEPEESQRRLFIIDGKEFNFSDKENLAYENLHKFVYQDLINGKGVLAKNVVELIKTIKEIS